VVILDGTQPNFEDPKMVKFAFGHCVKCDNFCLSFLSSKVRYPALQITSKPLFEIDEIFEKIEKNLNFIQNMSFKKTCANNITSDP